VRQYLLETGPPLNPGSRPILVSGECQAKAIGYKSPTAAHFDSFLQVGGPSIPRVANRFNRETEMPLQPEEKALLDTNLKSRQEYGDLVAAGVWEWFTSCDTSQGYPFDVCSSLTPGGLSFRVETAKNENYEAGFRVDLLPDGSIEILQQVLGCAGAWRRLLIPPFPKRPEE
jgi:hypothetical protein